MLLHLNEKVTMRRHTAMMVKGEEVTLLAIHGTKGGELYVTVSDGKNSDYVHSSKVAFAPHKQRDKPLEREPKEAWKNAER